MYEPSFEEVIHAGDPKGGAVPAPPYNFPAASLDISSFPDVIRKAKELKFAQIQVATNGLRMARSQTVKDCAEAGLTTTIFSLTGSPTTSTEDPNREPLISKEGYRERSQAHQETSIHRPGPHRGHGPNDHRSETS